jgi:outer membrane protein assembly factor BamD (BamD/ComL family)
MKQTFIALSCLILATSACMHNTSQQNQEHKESLTIDQLLSKPIKDMSFNEACRVKKYYENQHQNDMVIKCGEHLVSLATDQDETEKALLQLAELNMEEGKLEKAREHAENYQSLYPGTDNAEKALHIALKASYLSMLGSDRDQQPTEKTIQLAQNYLDTYKDNGAYTESVRDIVKNCYAQTIDSELKVAQTYLAKYDYTERESTLKAAEKRIAYIKDKLLA